MFRGMGPWRHHPACRCALWPLRLGGGIGRRCRCNEALGVGTARHRLQQCLNPQLYQPVGRDLEIGGGSKAASASGERVGQVSWQDIGPKTVDGCKRKWRACRTRLMAGHWARNCGQNGSASRRLCIQKASAAAQMSVGVPAPYGLSESAPVPLKGSASGAGTQ